jgi:hypothetical protein
MRATCPECERSNGPHYRGPCAHGGPAVDVQTLRPLLPAWLNEAADDVRRDLARVAARYPKRLAMTGGKLTVRRGE